MPIYFDAAISSKSSCLMIKVWAFFVFACRLRNARFAPQSNGLCERAGRTGILALKNSL